MEENLKVTGQLEVILKDEFGNIKFYDIFKNMVVTTGKNFIASRMTGTGSAVMSHMAIGTGTTAEALGQTALVTQANIKSLTATPTNNTVLYSCTFNAGEGTGAITEAGIFNAASAGTMLSRVVFSAVNKAAGDSLAINWTITVN